MRTLLLLALSLLSGCEVLSGAPREDTENNLLWFEAERRKGHAAPARMAASKIADREDEVAALCALSPSGSEGPTPPLKLNCNAAEDGDCKPVVSPSAPGEYNEQAWASPAWTASGYAPLGGHSFHASIDWNTLEDGTCFCRVRVFQDMDDDGIYSTFERNRYQVYPASKFESSKETLPLE